MNLTPQRVKLSNWNLLIIASKGNKQSSAGRQGSLHSANCRTPFLIRFLLIPVHFRVRVLILTHAPVVARGSFSASWWSLDEGSKSSSELSPSLYGVVLVGFYFSASSS